MHEVPARPTDPGAVRRHQRALSLALTYARSRRRTTLAHCLSELRGALLARLEELISEDDQYDSLEVVAIAFEKLARITVNFGADEMLDTINEAVDHIICQSLPHDGSAPRSQY